MMAEKVDVKPIIDIEAELDLPAGVPLPEQISGMRQLLGLDGILAHAYSLQSEAQEARDKNATPPKPRAHCPRGW